MAVLRLHFQVTGHKQPILAVGSHGDLLATAEHGAIRLWSFAESQAASGGPTLLMAVECSRQPIRVLFITPGALFVVGVFAEDGVVLFDIGTGLVERYVLLDGDKKEGKILAAAWNGDTCSLALATAAGGVKIYDLLPTTPCNSTLDASGDSDSGSRVRPQSGRIRPARPQPVKLILRHEIVIKCVSLIPNGGKKIVHRRVSSLATDESSEPGRQAGSAILVGVAEGQHLCVWDLVTGTTLLTALAIAPAGCKVEKVVWLGPAALTALLYSVEGGLRRIDVHQIDVAGQTATPLLSYTSDVLIAGMGFSTAPNTVVRAPLTSRQISTPNHPTSQTYLHVVDRLRTLRTWLLHPGGATAVAAYRLPDAAPRIPCVAADIPDRSGFSSAVGPESSHGDITPHELEGRRRHDSGRTGGGASWAGEIDGVGSCDRGRQQLQQQRHLETLTYEEEMVDPQSLAVGALVAAVIPSRLQGNAGPGVLVLAGVALSGVSFLSESDSFLSEGAREKPLWEVPVEFTGGEEHGGKVSRVLGMEGLVSGGGGDQQALAVVWAERPSFQVLDVGSAGNVEVVQDVSLCRRHREDQLEAAPRSDRPCFVTSWAHSATLGTLLCGWNDGTVDVINPRSPHQRSRLLPPDRACIPVTALCVIPLSLLPHLGNQFLSDSEEYVCGDSGRSNRVRLGVALVGSAEGALAMWPTSRAPRPWSVIMAHVDAVIAVRTAMDAPRDARRWSAAASAPADGNDCGDRTEGLNAGTGGSNTTSVGTTCPDRCSSFFVVTAGANREVKVWGIDAEATRRDVPPLALKGYTVVGARVDDQLTALELLSERFMACGFHSGAVEVWPIPFDSRGIVLGVARDSVQAFPLAHNAKVTSIVVSLGLRCRLEGGGSETAGRVVLTTSVDRTVVRWASIAPGESLKPLTRYCLSTQPASAVLLPPPRMASVGRPANPCPEYRASRKGVKTVENITAMFRVVAALDGNITILELATASFLLGGAGGRNSPYDSVAIANSFPGEPLIPRLSLISHGNIPEQERGAERCQWRVGGPRGREAGRYDVLGGIAGLSLEWENSGGRRIVAASASRKAWQVQGRGQKEAAGVSFPVGSKGGGAVEDSNQSVKKPKPESENRRTKGRRGTAKRTGNNVSTLRPSAVKASISTLEINPDKCADSCEFGAASENAYRKVRGGKTIKMDPEFSAAWGRCSLPKPKDSDGTHQAIIQHKGTAPDTAGVCSVELTMPIGYSGKVYSGTVPRSGIDEVSAVSLSVTASAFMKTASLLAERPETPIGDERLSSADSPVLGCPSAPCAPPNNDDAHTNALGISECCMTVPATTNTAQHAGPVDATSMSELASRNSIQSAQGEKTTCPGRPKEGGQSREMKVLNTVTLSDRGAENNKRPTMNSAVAAASIAREAREAGDFRRRLLAPVVVERREVVQELRQQFNFDSAQAPSSGMPGVGVAVPRGFADARLKAAKRSYCPSSLLRKTARRRVGGGHKRCAPADARSATADRETADAVATEEDDGGARVIEAFPTGLVVSKHFREASTGREILMLEVEKAAVIGSAGNARESRPSALLCRRSRGSNTGDAVDTELEAAAAAAAASAAELASLSPRSRSLREVFESLAAGRDVLTQDSLAKWSYVSHSIERGMVSQYQVKSFYRQAHGGRHRGKMVWQDMRAFYEQMEAALDTACAPPLTEQFTIDSEEWGSVSASVYLTKRGDVFVVALEAGSGSNSGRGDLPRTPPSPVTVRLGGDGGGGTRIGGDTRVVAAWATMTITNPDVPARLSLLGLKPECDYELYAYAENGAGRRRAGGGNMYSGGADDPMFCVEPAPAGMSAELVASTRLAARTAQEPDEELDVPWEDLSESEKMVEALAALNDPAVTRVARDAALDVPRAEDLAKHEADPVSRNKWRSFCRWWAGGVAAAGCSDERKAFLLRECVFAAQQPQIIEEAARMGVQLLEGDWHEAGVNSNTDITICAASTTTVTPSARQRRWTAFRSWYRGGRVFDRAHETLITAALLHRPPSPGSQGRPLTPRIAQVGRPQPAAPTLEETPEDETDAVGADHDVARASVTTPGGLHPPMVAATLGSFSGGVHGTTTPPVPPPPPEPVVHVTKLEEDPTMIDLRTAPRNRWTEKTINIPVANDGGNGDRRAAEAEVQEGRDSSELGFVATGADAQDDAKPFEGIDRWEQEKAEQTQRTDPDDGVGVSEGLPPVVHESGTAAAKKLRMEARRKFLAARTTTSKEAASKVGRLLDVKKEDIKAKRLAATASGVAARRNKAVATAKKRRRSQVARALALKRADELLQRSKRAQEIWQRRGSLGTVRPEDVAAIGVFDSFNVEEFDPEEADPALFPVRSSLSDTASSMDDVARALAAWAPRSPDELILELQLACVHPRVCIMAASAGIGVPDPEDAFSTLSHKKARWMKFSTWYYPSEEAPVEPQRKALLDGEVSAAMGDELVRTGMQEEGLLDSDENCEESDFLDWYCEEGAAPRQLFRRRRVEELLQSRRLVTTELLAYLPTPFLFQELPRSIHPPLPPTVTRFCLFSSRSPEVFSWEDVARWYNEDGLDADDEALRAGERAGQRTALLEAVREDEGHAQTLERRVARWEDFRSELMRAAEGELRNAPFSVGQGEWQYSATLRSWAELKFLGFDAGSGLENKDEVLDALEVARKEAQEERERVAEVRRQREMERLKRLNEERRRREEEERLRWMRETEERRRLVQQHMVNLKRQRALEAERGRMAREEALTLLLMQEEKRLLQVGQAEEAAAAEERRLRELEAAAAEASAAQVQRQLDAETVAMALEDQRSQEVEEEKRAAETALRERETYLRDLYTSFVPLWGEETSDMSPAGVPLGEGEGEEGRAGDRRGAWWTGADAPKIWSGPSISCPRLPKARPGPRFVPHARALLDGLDPQHVSLGRLSREYLALLDLPHESIRDMYDKGTRTVNDGDAMVDGIQLGRVFTMFEQDEVCNHLVPVVPLERVGTRQFSKDGRGNRPEHRRRRPQTIAPGEPRRRCIRHLSDKGALSSAIEDGARNLIGPTRDGARTAGPLGRCEGSGDGSVRASSDVRWRRQRGRHVVPVGAKAIVGLPLSGDERGCAMTATLLHEAQQDVKGEDMAVGPSVGHGERPLPLSTTYAHLGRDRATMVEMLGTRDAAELKVSRGGGGLVERLSSAMPRITNGAQCEATLPRGVPQEHPQWGGFGTGHVPRYFRGKFGIAGEKKRLIGRKGEGVVGGAGLDDVVSGVTCLPKDMVSEGGEENASVGVVGGGSTSTSVE